MKWIKAIERMPDVINSYCCRVNGGYTTLWVRQVRDGVLRFEDNTRFVVKKNTIEWLDESEEKKMSKEAEIAFAISADSISHMIWKEQIIAAHMNGQRNAGIDPSYHAAFEYYLSITTPKGE